MKIPSKEKIIYWLTSAYTIENESLPGACHCINVGLAMEAIAKQTHTINPMAAKAMGFLHDVGKMDVSTYPFFNGEKHAHDIVGFDFLIKEGFPDVAYGALTHSLLSGNLDNDYNRAMFFYNEKDIKRLKDLLKNHLYTDTEKLLQLCDWIVQKDHICTIENSYEFIKKYYGYYECLDDCLKKAMEIKKYFDKICKTDIYQICEAAIIKKWDTTNFVKFISMVI